MDSKQDFTYAQQAVSNGYITIQQLQQAISIKKQNPSIAICQILLQKNWITDIEMRSLASNNFPQMFLHYELKNKLGQGGMGAVYLAFDTKLQRNIALKFIISESRVQAKRLLQEAMVMAKINHPNIVKVFEVGDSPKPFFTMEYIEGHTLSSLIYKDDLSFPEIATIIMQISSALYDVHKMGILHRDIKPANVMVANSKEPKVMDFGLAKIQDVENSLSFSKQIMGTPAYMSPEQSQGFKLDHRADIYSLGASFYEMLTKRKVFQAKNYASFVLQILEKEPIQPLSLNPDIPVELEAICLKCLEKKKENRYISARLLAKDLENFLENRPVSAQPLTNIVKFKRFVKKRFLYICLALFVFMAIFSGGIFSFIQWQKAEALKITAISANKEVEQLRKKEEEEKIKITKRFAKVALKKAEEAMETKEYHKSAAFAGETIKFISNFNNYETMKSKGFSYLKLSLFHNYFRINPSKIFQRTYYHPQEKIIVVAGNEDLYVFANNFVHISFHLGLSDLIKTSFTEKESIKHLFFYRDSIIFMAQDGQVFLWQYTEDKLSTLFSNITNIDVRGDYLCFSSNNQVALWNISSWQNKFSKNITAEQIKIHPTQEFIVTKEKQTISIYSFEGDLHKKIEENQSIQAIEFSPKNDLLYITQQIIQYDLEQGETYRYSSIFRNNLIFSPSGDYFAIHDNYFLQVHKRNSDDKYMLEDKVHLDGKLSIGQARFFDDSHLQILNVENKQIQHIFHWDFHQNKQHEIAFHLNYIQPIIYNDQVFLVGYYNKYNDEQKKDMRIYCAQIYDLTTGHFLKTVELCKGRGTYAFGFHYIAPSQEHIIFLSEKSLKVVSLKNFTTKTIRLTKSFNQICSLNTQRAVVLTSSIGHMEIVNWDTEKVIYSNQVPETGRKEHRYLAINVAPQDDRILISEDKVLKILDMKTTTWSMQKLEFFGKLYALEEDTVFIQEGVVQFLHSQQKFKIADASSIQVCTSERDTFIVLGKNTLYIYKKRERWYEYGKITCKTDHPFTTEYIYKNNYIVVANNKNISFHKVYLKNFMMQDIIGNKTLASEQIYVKIYYSNKIHYISVFDYRQQKFIDTGETGQSLVKAVGKNIIFLIKSDQYYLQNVFNGQVERHTFKDKIEECFFLRNDEQLVYLTDNKKIYTYHFANKTHKLIYPKDEQETPNSIEKGYEDDLLYIKGKNNSFIHAFNLEQNQILHTFANIKHAQLLPGNEQVVLIDSQHIYIKNLQQNKILHSILLYDEPLSLQVNSKGIVCAYCIYENGSQETRRVLLFSMANSKKILEIPVPKMFDPNVSLQNDILLITQTDNFYYEIDTQDFFEIGNDVEYYWKARLKSKSQENLQAKDLKVFTLPPNLFTNEYNPQSFFTTSYKKIESEYITINKTKIKIITLQKFIKDYYNNKSEWKDVHKLSSIKDIAQNIHNANKIKVYYEYEIIEGSNTKNKLGFDSSIFTIENEGGNVVVTSMRKE